MSDSILTPRLLLRPFTPADEELIYKIYSDPGLLRYTPLALLDRRGAREHLDAVLEWWRQDPVVERELAVVVRDTGRAVGRCHVSVDPENDTGMIGCFLLRAAQGGGYGTEVIGALLRHCFLELHLHRVCGLCSPENTASRRMMEKNGMRLEGHFREKLRYLWEGRTTWHDELEYALLADELPC